MQVRASLEKCRAGWVDGTSTGCVKHKLGATRLCLPYADDVEGIHLPALISRAYFDAHRPSGCLLTITPMSTGGSLLLAHLYYASSVRLDDR